MLIKVENLIDQMERQIEKMKRAAHQEDWNGTKEAASILESYCHVIKENHPEKASTSLSSLFQEEPAVQQKPSQVPLQTPQPQPIMNQVPTTSEEKKEKRNLLDF
ncbi:DUF5327 family protein [Shouchella sp. JSM 1781072]|uniref:DUF5327 family protein n=1 Tax=Shouchella sp. JSM 1781072 TaxID=3344581 RepID=UPI0035C07A82